MLELFYFKMSQLSTVLNTGRDCDWPGLHVNQVITMVLLSDVRHCSVFPQLPQCERTFIRIVAVTDE